MELFSKSLFFKKYWKAVKVSINCLQLSAYLINSLEESGPEICYKADSYSNSLCTKLFRQDNVIAFQPQSFSKNTTLSSFEISAFGKFVQFIDPKGASQNGSKNVWYTVLVKLWKKNFRQGTALIGFKMKNQRDMKLFYFWRNVKDSLDV